MRQFLRCTWPAMLLLAAGCGDNIELVYRDYCNVQHEVLDEMMYVVDEESAKRFNDSFEKRIVPKEDVIQAREEKILNNLFTQADKQIAAEAIIDMEKSSLKGQLESLESRAALSLQRVRRLIVKMVEDKAAEAKQANQSFTIKSNELCPNLTKLRRGKHFTKTDGGGGGMAGGMAPMMPGGAPMPGGGADPGAMQEADPKGPLTPKKYITPNANLNRDFEFVLECRRTDDPQNPWQETRSWRGAPAEVTVKGINLIPKYSVQ